MAGYPVACRISKSVSYQILKVSRIFIQIYGIKPDMKFSIRQNILAYTYPISRKHQGLISNGWTVDIQAIRKVYKVKYSSWTLPGMPPRRSSSACSASICFVILSCISNSFLRGWVYPLNLYCKSCIMAELQYISVFLTALLHCCGSESTC